jgi:hypothetical protein
VQALRDRKIEGLKQALKKGDVKASKDVDLNEVKDILTDPKTETTPLGIHYTCPGKQGEYIYMVASVRIVRDINGEKDGETNPRTWGWVATEEEARKAVAMNAGDLNEANYYKYAVIEKLASGIFCVDMEQIAWFEWVNNPVPLGKPNKYEGEWVEIPQPEWAKNVMGWTL